MFRTILSIAVLVVSTTAEAQPANFVFCCQPGSDLYRAIGGQQRGYPRFATPAEAVRAATEGAGVLILADGYPTKTTVVEPAVLNQAAKKHLRLYVEYPAELPGVQFGPPTAIKLERGVVTSKIFGDALPPMRIVMINGCRFLPITGGSPSQPHLVLARVAGVDTAVFGLNKTPTRPLLFDLPGGNVLVATTKLSHFVTGRYMPQEAWRAIWRTILGRLQPGAVLPTLAWTPTVRPSYGRDEPLPADVELQALHRSADWITHSRILRSPKWPKKALDWSLHYNTVRDMPSAKWPIGDGSFGILEGYSSTIRADGSQPMRYAVRNDNMCEVAMLMALDAANHGPPQHQAIAVNLLNFIFLNSGLAAGNRANPASPEYGLISWSFDLPQMYWSDDSGRSTLSLLAVSALLNDKAATGRLGSSNASPTAESSPRPAGVSFPLNDALCALRAGQFPQHRRLRLSRGLHPGRELAEERLATLLEREEHAIFTPLRRLALARLSLGLRQDRFQAVSGPQRNRHADADASLPGPLVLVRPQRLDRTVAGPAAAGLAGTGERHAGTSRLAANRRSRSDRAARQFRGDPRDNRRRRPTAPSRTPSTAPAKPASSRATATRSPTCSTPATSP